MLSVYQGLVILLLAGHTLAGPFPAEPDKDQPLIDRLNKFVENVHNRVSESNGRERLRVVVNTSAEVLEFFKFMGYLLLNGTLGECVDGVRHPTGIKCVIHMSQNRSRFRDEVVGFLAEDRDGNLKDTENFPLLVLPEWELGQVDADDTRSYLKGIFSSTWKFFDHMQGHIAEDRHPVVILAGTVNSRGNDLTSAQMRFIPCMTCLYKFVVRYNNYSAKAYESFVGHVTKYLYWDTVAHGLCLSITWNGELVNATEAERRREWMMQNLASIGRGLLEVDSVLTETPPPYWNVEAKRVMENVIGNETVPYPSSSEAVHFYKEIYDRFQSDVRSIAALRIKNLSDSTIDVLVYYPAFDSAENCYRNLTNVILSGQFSGANYVVSIRQGYIPSWITSEKATMERHFKDSKEQDQCDRIADVDRKMENKLTGSDDLRAVVAVKCARRFVWYELGYQYFPAAYTEAPTVPIKHESTYNSNCAMLVLFP